MTQITLSESGSLCPTPTIPLVPHFSFTLSLISLSFLSPFFYFLLLSYAGEEHRKADHLTIRSALDIPDLRLSCRRTSLCFLKTREVEGKWERKIGKGRRDGVSPINSPVDYGVSSINSLVGDGVGSCRFLVDSWRGQDGEFLTVIGVIQKLCW